MNITGLFIERLIELWNTERAAMILFGEKCPPSNSFITNELKQRMIIAVTYTTFKSRCELKA